ncbi:hypothetical protein WJX79_001457 [Trebouxia sp. C0005]
MSDPDSAGSHGRANKALRSAGGQVARVRRQFEAADALPSPARATVSAPQVPAAKAHTIDLYFGAFASSPKHPHEKAQWQHDEWDYKSTRDHQSLGVVT